MIYTVTLNPSLDYLVTVSDFTEGKTNRTETELILPGGKGINVSIVLKNLGVESTILGFTAGFTGTEIKKQIAAAGCKERLIEVPEGLSRINIKLHATMESEINGRGPQVDERSLTQLYQQLERLQAGDVLVLSGSIPPSLSQDIYQEILKHLADKEILVVVDAEDELLLRTLSYRPFLLKPNQAELGKILQTEITNRAEAIKGAKELQRRGARNVLVSMGAAGAILVSETGLILSGEAPKETAINTVGAGDSMVAGFLAGYQQTHNVERAFVMSIAAGSASAYAQRLATKEAVETLVEQIHYGEWG